METLRYIPTIYLPVWKFRNTIEVFKTFEEAVQYVKREARRHKTPTCEYVQFEIATCIYNPNIKAYQAIRKTGGILEYGQRKK